MGLQDWLAQRLSYNSVRFIKVQNIKLGLVFWCLQLAILLYILVYQVVLQKGYQNYDQVVGTTTVKVKGSASVGSTVYDSNDLCPQNGQQDSFFVMTNFYTVDQTRSVCEGNDKATELPPCQPGKYSANGVETGGLGLSKKYCNISAWCPVQADTSATPNLLTNTGKLTVFAKVNAYFPNFNIARTNAENSLINGTNYFLVQDFAAMANVNWTTSLLAKGAIILVSIDFECDLNQGVDQCNPKLSANRIDYGNFSSGFNYRFVKNGVRPDGTPYRTLTKAVGIRVLFSITGRAGRFGLVPLVIALGSGVALLSLSNLICDFVLQHFMPHKDQIQQRKYNTVDLDHLEGLESSNSRFAGGEDGYGADDERQQQQQRSSKQQQGASDRAPIIAQHAQFSGYGGSGRG